MVDWPSVPETLEALPSAAAVLSTSGDARVMVNRSFIELYDAGSGSRARELTRDGYERLLLERTEGEDRDRLAAFLERVDGEPGLSETLTVSFATPGKRRMALWTTPITDGEGRVVGRLILHREERESTLEAGSELERAHRELRDAQTALLRSEKMASLGHLVTGVAHEINTPVGSIHSNGDLMVRAVEKLRELLSTNTNDGLKESPELARTVEVLDEIGRVNRTACERIVEIVRSLKNFARPEELERRETDLHEDLESTLTLVHHELKNRVQVVRDYGELPKIECYPNQINQVFMNILVNASQAIAGEGEIRIRTWSDGSMVHVELTDDGVGIRPENLERIFEPGFTTKGAGQGTGLGLSICSRIVQAHGGDIAVRSTPGEGTTFTVSLPIRSSLSPRSRRESGEAGPKDPGGPGGPATESKGKAS